MSGNLRGGDVCRLRLYNGLLGMLKTENIHTPEKMDALQKQGEFFAFL
jgi:hypothetical protein